ncbi:MAG TPA: efflux RND transporter periplasmic adaptor subunit [Nitrospiraceae bacterium]|nr:efflux RND transporter periplasmic adaptor subunit [Nitrospiraceae bacterium]
MHPPRPCLNRFIGLRSTDVHRFITAFIILASLSAMGLMGCKDEATSSGSGLPLEVEVVTVVQKDVPIYSEGVGTTDGMVNAVIKAQVNGYLMKQTYDEGAFVKKGQVLFEIDPRKFQAALDQAKGEWAKAKAQFVKTELDVKRDKPLAQGGAISQKELDDSIQANIAATASVASAKAAVEQAELNLSFTRIIAPIDGIVGIAKAQIGDLVGPGDELASMSMLDPIRVYVSISEQEYLRVAGKISQEYKNKDREDPKHDLELVLADGSIYPEKGAFFVADRQVDVKTGTIRLAARFPNPGNILRPGQFARTRLLTNTKHGALLVPQRSVTELQGGYQVAVVTPDNKVEIRPVKVGERTGNLWIIEEGLAAGERVVAEGVQKVKPGMTIVPKTFGSTPEGRIT